MISVKHLDIAVIGDKELVAGLRLVGVSKYYIIESDHDAGEDVREALTRLIADPDVGIVIMQEDYVGYAEDLLDRVKEEKKMTPVIIEAPSKYGTTSPDVRAYYKAYIRKFIGFDVEI